MSCSVLILLGSGDEVLLPHTCAQDVLAWQKLIILSLTGTSWDLNNAAVKQEHVGGPSGDSTSSRVSHICF